MKASNDPRATIYRQDDPYRPKAPRNTMQDDAAARLLAWFGSVTMEIVPREPIDWVAVKAEAQRMLDRDAALCRTRDARRR